MQEPSTERAVLLRERSRALRRHAETTRATSRVLHGRALHLCDAARDILIDSSTHSRLRLAGGSGRPDDQPASFALSIVHELTPALATLLLRLESMLDGTRDHESPTNLVGDLETLHRRVEQMTVIVRALNALGGESGFEPQPIDLNGVVEELLPSIISALTVRVVVRPNLDQGIPPVLAETKALRYALTSLIEAVAEGSPAVDIATRRETDGVVRVDVGTSGKPGTVRELTLHNDPIRLVLAQSIVQSLGGTVEQRIANPGRTFTVKLRAAGAR